MAQQWIERVPRDFTDDEKDRMKDELVERLGDVYMLRARKKQETAEINAQISGAEKICAELQEKIRAGFEMIEVDVTAALNEPVPGTKKIIRMDTLRELRTEPMTSRERQESLFEDMGEEPKGDGR